MKKSPHLKLCEGFRVRAGAFYAAGEFEKALLDFCSCCDRKEAPEFQLGVDNCRESIRRAFDYSEAQIERALACLEKGVFLEKETRKPSSQPRVTLKRAVEYDDEVREVSGFGEMGGIAAETRSAKNSVSLVLRDEPDEQNEQTPQKQTPRNALTLEQSQDLLKSNVSLLHQVQARAKQAENYSTLGPLAEDKAFFEFVSDMPNLKQLCADGVSYINSREQYWETRTKSAAADRARLEQTYQTIRPARSRSLSATSNAQK